MERGFNLLMSVSPFQPSIELDDSYSTIVNHCGKKKLSNWMESWKGAASVNELKGSDI